MPYNLNPIIIQAGCSPTTENTAQNTPHYLFADKIRFCNNVPEKIGGWTSLSLSGIYGINGTPRNIFSYTLGGTIYYLVGTHSNLYLITDQNLFNATPVVTAIENYNNVLATNYGTLGSDPYSTTLGSNIITVTDTAHPFRDGDVLTFSGATTFSGLSSGDLNGSKSISDVTTNTYSYYSENTATGTASGGGASVIRASRIISVTQTNDYREGDNVMVDNVASDVGGITVAQIEGIRVARNVTTSSYDIEASGTATSSVSSAGGNYDIYPEIADGVENPTTGQGYGMGQYGIGLYGVSKTASSPTEPSIWSFDRFGNLVIATQGNQTGLYSWNSSSTTLPALVANAPTQINYAFVSDNICVTLGDSNVPNRIKWCDQGDLETWTATSTNQAGEDDIEGAGEFKSHLSLRGINLLFTNESVYSFRYIRRPFIWETKLVDSNSGLIARNARVAVNGIAYWMGKHNFYMYRGGNVEPIPSNSGPESTLKDYVFKNINRANASKSFAWYNREFNEIWFHYPCLNSTECDIIARYNVLDRTWVMDTMNRSAAEYPSVLSSFPYVANTTGTIYLHERGNDDDTVSMPWTLTTPFFFTGTKETAYLGGIYQDNTMTSGTIDVTINTKRYPNQTAGTSTYNVDTGDANLIYRKSARYWQYSVSGDSLGQFWRGGSWQELVKGGSKR
jgi:hypothetical protein